MSLPITEFLPDIIRTISTSATSAIISPTGTGKSIAIPTTLANLGSRVLVSVPTRTAVYSLAAYAQTYNTQPLKIGTAAEGDIRYDISTQLIYATAGHVRRQLLTFFTEGRALPMDFVDVLIVDEAHLATVDISLILDLWQYAYRQGVQVPRLVLTTATPATLNLQPAPTEYRVSMRTYDITYRYLAPNSPKVRPDQIVDMVRTEIQQVLANGEGNILAFVPGSQQVDQLVNSLRHTNVMILAAYSALSSEELARIHQSTDARKVIIATNIAETAITIENVAYVIDSMYEKVAETSQAGGFRLATALIAKDSAAQRAGRTGRTRPGVCIRLITQENFNQLPATRVPEIQRVPIYEILMQLLAVGLEPEIVLQGVPKAKISSNVQLLRKLHMIDERRNVTERGDFAASYPLSVRNSALLFNWLEQKYPPFVGIVLAALIDSYGPNYMFIPRDLQDASREDYIHKHFEKYVSPSDLQTAILIWVDLFTYLNGDINSKDYSKWSKENSMNNKKIKELLHVVKQCLKISRSKGYDVVLGKFPPERVIDRSLPLLLEIYDNALLTHLARGEYSLLKSSNRYTLDKDSLLRYTDKYPPYLLGLVMAEISTRRGNLNFINFSVDVPKSLIPTEDTPDLLSNLLKLNITPRFSTQTVVSSRDTPIDYNEVEVVDASEYSSLLPMHIQQVEAIWLTEAPTLNKIIDGTAHIGMDSILLRLIYPQANIISVENDAATYQALVRNNQNLSSILRGVSTPPLIPVQASIVDYLASAVPADVLYVDPPWGGPNYKSKTNLHLYLNGTDVQDVINQAFNLGIPLVVLKAPFNFDQDSLVNFLSLNQPEVELRRYDVTTPQNRTSFLLYFMSRV